MRFTIYRIVKLFHNFRVLILICGFRDGVVYSMSESLHLQLILLHKIIILLHSSVIHLYSKQISNAQIMLFTLIVAEGSSILSSSLAAISMQL